MTRDVGADFKKILSSYVGNRMLHCRIVHSATQCGSVHLRGILPQPIDNLKKSFAPKLARLLNVRLQVAEGATTQILIDYAVGMLGWSKLGPMRTQLKERSWNPPGLRSS